MNVVLVVPLTSFICCCCLCMLDDVVQAVIQDGLKEEEEEEEEYGVFQERYDQTAGVWHVNKLFVEVKEGEVPSIEMAFEETVKEGGDMWW